ncbi:hypothetical protein MUK42_34303 [Musa troglodytarum]|uniref:Uncharacterized protein n=1 Tax=Musa troglodytarum TaxID=320322 RepID=A0A9E7HC20_9LILI|nr:hypothetical protein MUK42_34303 [Musa troglodytarum]
MHAVESPGLDTLQNVYLLVFDVCKGTGRANPSSMSDSVRMWDVCKGTGRANPSSMSDSVRMWDVCKGTGRANPSSMSDSVRMWDACKGTGRANPSSMSDSIRMWDVCKGTGRANPSGMSDSVQIFSFSIIFGNDKTTENCSGFVTRPAGMIRGDKVYACCRGKQNFATLCYSDGRSSGRELEEQISFKSSKVLSFEISSKSFKLGASDENTWRSL